MISCFGANIFDICSKFSLCFYVRGSNLTWTVKKLCHSMHYSSQRNHILLFWSKFQFYGDPMECIFEHKLQTYYFYNVYLMINNIPIHLPNNYHFRASTNAAITARNVSLQKYYHRKPFRRASGRGVSFLPNIFISSHRYLMTGLLICFTPDTTFTLVIP